MDDSDPATAASLEDLAACLKHVHLLADKPTFRALEQQTTHANGLLPGTRLKRARLTRTTVSDIMLGRKFPGKAFLLTFVEACGVDLEGDRRWEQAWDRLAPQYQQAPASSEVEELRQETERLRQQLAGAETRAAAAEELRQQLTAAGDRVAAIAGLVENAIPGDCALPGTWPACAALLPLARAVLADESAGLEWLADYLGWSGSPVAARDLQQKTLGARVRVLGPEHPDILTARARLATWTGKAGDAAAARDQLAGLVPDLERALGPEHPDTLTARARLAIWTWEAAASAAARDQLAGLVSDFERVLGPEAPQTLITIANLASMTGAAGDAEPARDQLAGLVPDLERVLGREHPQTLTARARLACLTGEAGDAAAARDLFARLVPDLERALGPEHPDTWSARSRHAAWTGAAGDAAAARDLFAALIRDFEQIPGPEQPQTLTARAGLAYWAGEAGDAEPARDLFARLVPDLERALGPEHPDTLFARTQLPYWTGKAGDAAAARDLFAALVPDLERVLGPEHPQTLTARLQLGRFTGNTEDDAAARGNSGVSVIMPQLGESVTEGTVTRWLKKEGERVEVDEPLLEVSTDKVDTEIPSPASGILRGISVDEDETVAVGVQLAVIGIAPDPSVLLVPPAADTPPPRRGYGSEDTLSARERYQDDDEHSRQRDKGGKHPVPRTPRKPGRARRWGLKSGQDEDPADGDY